MPLFESLALPVSVANGGTGGSAASITLFNNITGYTASGATGTTSTNLVFSTSPALTTPTIVTSAILNRDGIAGTSSDGYVLANATAAAAGAQQWSPRLRFTGQGWKTTATAASQTVDWIIENVPVQGSSAPTTALSFSSQINVGGFTESVQFLPNRIVFTSGTGGGFHNDTFAGLYVTDESGNGRFVFEVAGSAGSGFSITSGDRIGIRTNSNPVYLFAGAGSNALWQRNSTSAQLLSLSNTYTSTTNYERFDLDWQTTSNVLLFGTQKGSGGGTARVASWVYGGTSTPAISVPITPGSVTFGGGITLADAGDITINATTGTKLATATSQKLGFWNVTPIIQPAGAGQAAYTDSTGGTPAASLVDVGVVFSQANINNNFATVSVLLLAIRTALVNAGLMKGAA